MKPPQNQVNALELAALLGVAPKTVRRWIELGLPVLQAARRGRGGSATLDLEAALLWVAGREVSPFAGDWSFVRSLDIRDRALALLDEMEKSA